MLTPSHDPELYVLVATPTKFDPMNRYELSSTTSSATAVMMAAFDLRGFDTMPMRYTADFGRRIYASASRPSVKMKRV